MGNDAAASNVKVVVLTTKPHFTSNFKLRCDALVMVSISGLLPSVAVKAVRMVEWDNLAAPRKMVQSQGWFYHKEKLQREY